MKKQLTTLFTGLSAEQVNSLTTVVAETLATGLEAPKPKIFTAADLWNIQRQKRAFISRRFSF